MKFSISDRLLNRELAGPSRSSSIRTIYGDQRWVRDLDIVNELEGHDGCVNALSWSKTGMLLASGSDDQRLNIHRFQPEDSNKPFSLATTVQTGHSANIFSVKFMPHSNDQTLVSAAGDGQVRIFDIEHGARSSVPTAGSLPQADRLQGLLHNGTRFLSAVDTSAKVFRSHGDRVKRIVTESSPHLFLTCSEDGEVRQWDLRQPSSAYPRPRESSSGDSGVPPPLISYKRYQIDLNTISCSPSQPHYIALGGAHLHTFLHDRRMLGRSKHLERGQPDSSSPHNDTDDTLMGEATKCVRRFAPHGHRRMKRSGNGHITACKISDANPNEMIASWSGDHIYSFDLIRSPDARDQPEDSQAAAAEKHRPNQRAHHSRDRKRKRTKEGSVLSQDGTGRAASKPRASASGEPPAQSLRVKYENGQSEDIPIRESEDPSSSLAEAAESAMSEDDKRSYRIANTSVKIRKSIFTLDNQKHTTDTDPTGFASSFTSALGFCASILEDMDDVIKTWRYPLEPDEVEIVLQTTLKRNRESARRFVQAIGTVSRLLGGKLQTAGGAEHLMLSSFARIVPAPNEAPILDDSEQFRYDFIKAIALWLDSGPGAVVEGFSRQRPNSRFPLPGDSGVEAIDDLLIPHLLRLASDDPVPDVDASRFEVDENRKVFETEKSAVLAFASAVKIPFEDLSRAIVPTSSGENGASVTERFAAQDRQTALRFWGLKAARGLLMMAGEGVNHTFVDRAFGGLGGPPSARVREDERLLNERLYDIDPELEEPTVDSVGLIANGNDSSDVSDDDMIPAEEVRAVVDEVMMGNADEESEHEDNEDYDNDDGDDASDNDGEDSDSDRNNSDSSDGDDDEEAAAAQSFLFRSGQSLRTQVNLDVPCSPHTRTYIGHCNVKTVKDVNFYGLNDEYVVSGSDSGHLFIWDKNSAQLLNILEGDGEVVNVVQGHPYEPVLAVSGIDHTVKIFSPDARTRHDARHGIGVSNVDSSGFSSLRYGSRTRFGQARRPPRSPPAPPSARTKQPDDAGDEDSAERKTDNGTMRITSESAVSRRIVDDLSSEDDEYDRPPRPVSNGGLSSRRRMHDSYAILSQNDMDRRGGQREAFITRSMLAQLAARMRVQLGGGAGGNTGGGTGSGNADGTTDGGGAEGEAQDDDGLTLHFEGGGSIVLRDDCEVM